MTNLLDQAPLVQAGQMRSLIQIQAKSLAPDPVTGLSGQSWDTVRTTRARIVSASEKEFFQANQYTDQATHLVKIRWRSIPLQAGMRIVYGTRIFTIQNIENVQERNVLLNIMCVEINGVTS